jgi:predicted nucleic acid-binding Zn ribbon protein
MKNPWTGEDPDRGLNALDATLEDVLERVTEGRLAAFEIIKSSWPEIVSEAWRERSRPVRLEKGVLTIEVSDGGAASRLRLEQRQIREALRQRLGRDEVAKIKLRVGRSGDWSGSS